jgi:hypothetical protein
MNMHDATEVFLTNVDKTTQYDFTQAYQHQNKIFYKKHEKPCEEDTSFLNKLAPEEHHHQLYH